MWHWGHWGHRWHGIPQSDAVSMQPNSVRDAIKFIVLMCVRINETEHQSHLPTWRRPPSAFIYPRSSAQAQFQKRRSFTSFICVRIKFYPAWTKFYLCLHAFSSMCSHAFSSVCLHAFSSASESFTWVLTCHLICVSLQICDLICVSAWCCAG